MAEEKKPTGFRLRVSAGPDTDHLTVLSVNDDSNPLQIESDEFVGQIVVRIKGLDRKFGYEQGQLKDNLKILPDSPWFTNPGGDSNLSSVQISGRFKREWSGDQVVFGVSASKDMCTCAQACTSLKDMLDSPGDWMPVDENGPGALESLFPQLISFLSNDVIMLTDQNHHAQS